MQLKCTIYISRNKKKLAKTTTYKNFFLLIIWRHKFINNKKGYYSVTYKDYYNIYRGCTY